MSGILSLNDNRRYHLYRKETDMRKSFDALCGLISNELGKNALSRALEEWRAGKPAGEIASTKPVIHITDNNRNPKQSLEEFKILGETPGRSGRTYAVELSLKHPDEHIKTEYIVVGIDPLWVFRREDFELLMHWDHRMPKLSKETNTSAKD